MNINVNRSFIVTDECGYHLDYLIRTLQGLSLKLTYIPYQDTLAGMYSSSVIYFIEVKDDSVIYNPVLVITGDLSERLKALYIVKRQTDIAYDVVDFYEEINSDGILYDINPIWWNNSNVLDRDPHTIASANEENCLHYSRNSSSGNDHIPNVTVKMNSGIYQGGPEFEKTRNSVRSMIEFLLDCDIKDDASGDFVVYLITKCYNQELSDAWTMGKNGSEFREYIYTPLFSFNTTELKTANHLRILLYDLAKEFKGIDVLLKDVQLSKGVLEVYGTDGVIYDVKRTLQVSYGKLEHALDKDFNLHYVPILRTKSNRSDDILYAVTDMYKDLINKKE